jgi:ABC-2 type transport system permease protein
MMRIRALVRAHWQTMRSYRAQTLMTFGGIVVSVLPLYLISTAVQPVMGPSIAEEGGSAFGFLAIGLATYMLVGVSVNALPQVVSDRINSGVLEALLATPVSLGELLAGLTLFDLVLAALRAAVLLGAAALLGATLDPHRLIPALLILSLIVLAHLPFGLIGAAMVIAFRSAGPFSKVILLVSGLLGGVYYPTSVVPSWLRDVSSALPLSHGLRALRRVLLQQADLAAVAPDIMALASSAVVLLVFGIGAALLALRQARAHGTLAQY